MFALLDRKSGAYNQVMDKHDTFAKEPSVNITDYAHDLIAVPRAHVRMVFSQDAKGVSLTHEGHDLVRCPLTRSGMAAAGFMSQAMGVDLPALGESVPIRVSTGVLFRVIAIAELDYKITESGILLHRFLEEAELQRGGAGGSE